MIIATQAILAFALQAIVISAMSKYFPETFVNRALLSS
ncbi:MAG: hypothetical protein ACI8R9_000078 [Paraglaciecola sp.]|jgi:hypothetical protein